MSETTDIPKETPRSITRNLRALRGKIFRWFFVDGANRVLLALIGFCVVSFAIDRLFRMDKPQRIVMLVLGIGFVAWVAWKKLVRPLLSRLSDDALILEVEKQTPEAKEQLITALEFSRMDWSKHPNASKGMVARTIEQGGEAGAALDFSKVLRGGRFATNTVLLAILAVVTIIGLVLIPLNTNFKTWFNRNVLIGNMQWPQDYFFDIDGVVDSEITVPRGDDWPIIAKVRDGYRTLPETAKIEFRSDRGSGRSSTMDPGSEGKKFFHTLRSVTEEYEFRVTTKKVSSEWISVKLVERPTIDSIALEQTPPEYTGEGPSALEIGSGPYYLLRGSSLRLKGTASKPLSKAALQIGDMSLPLQIDGKQFSGEIPAEKLAGGSYFLEIQDQETIVIPNPDADPVPQGLTPREPAQFKVRLRDDAAPELEFALRGVSTMIVPRARLPYRGSAEDDYSVTDIKIGYEIKSDRAAADDIQSGEVKPSGIASKLGQKRIVLEDYVELEPFDVPIDSRLSVTMHATDNDTVSEGGPKTGNSTTIHLRVVSESELRTDLLRREKEQRNVLLGILTAQDELLTDTQAFLAETRSVPEIDKATLARLIKLQRLQKLQGTNLKPMVERIEGIIAEIQNNRLEEEDGVLKRRLRTKVLTPLRNLWEEAVPVATQQLERARRAPGDMQLRNGILFDTAQRQQAIIASIRGVLENMVQDEDFQQAVNLLYEMQKLQSELNAKTEAEKAARLKELIEQGTKKEASE